MEFSTFDADNDLSASTNCAEYVRGANWWNKCGRNNINGPYEENIKNIKNNRFIVWSDWRTSGKKAALKTTKLMVRPVA